MEKRGARIILGSIICSVIVGLLFIVAIRFLHHSCELIDIEPIQLRGAALSLWPTTKPMRSRDKTMLLQISAYLEYDVQSPPVTNSNDQQYSPPAALHTQNQQQYPPTGHQQIQQLQPQQQIPQPQLQQNLMQQTLATSPVASIPQSGFTNQQIQNNSSFNSSQQTTINSGEKRFLPLQFDYFDSKAIDDTQHKYVLKFNCTTMTMIVVRRPDQVYIDRISLDLRPSNKQRSSCEIQLGPTSGYVAQIRNNTNTNLAHYYSCERQLTPLSCSHHSTNIHLANLHIINLEFETSTNSSHRHHYKSHEFQVPRVRCDL